MQPDLWSLYRQMLRSRLFEVAVKRLWEAGLISGEMHLGMGEEAIAAGVVDHLRDGDALALDHRGTPALLMRGVDAVALLREMLGRPDGLCRGMGGHMHLFSPEHLAASSGIVGAAGPAAVGFALAAQHLRPQALAVAFFGEGAMNQGHLLEAFNLAAAWKLPAIFVCKDSGWAITTRSAEQTGGDLVERAEGFGVPALRVDGLDVEAVWHAAGEAVERARDGGGPSFLHACCVHLEGHFLGDLLLRIARRPLREMAPLAGPLTRSLFARGGAPFRQRVGSMASTLALVRRAASENTAPQRDPLLRTRSKLLADRERLRALEDEVSREIEQIAAAALAPA